MTQFVQTLKTKDWQAYLRLAIILGILTLSAYFGRSASSRLVMMLIAVVGLAFALLVLINHLEWGLIALIPVSFFLPFSINTGTKISLNGPFLMIPMLIGLWLVKMIIFEREVRLAASRANLPGLLFIVGATVSLIIGNLQLVPMAVERASLVAQIGGLLLYVLPVGLMLLTINLVRDLKTLKILTYEFLIFGMFYVLLSVMVPVIPFFPVSKLYAVESAGSVFWTFLAALAFGQILFNRELEVKWRLALIAGLVGMFIDRGIWSREWVSGWLPPIVAMFVILWLKNWKWGLAISLAVAAVVAGFYTILHAQVMTPSQQYSISSRAATLPILLSLIRLSPIFGLGPANYYHYTTLYSLLGYYVKFNSHNNYIDILAQIGGLGMILFLWLVAVLGLTGWKLHLRLKKNEPNGFQAAYTAAVLGGLAGMLFSGILGDWFMPFLYNIGIPGFRAALFGWLFLGGMLALSALNSKQQNSGELKP